MKSELERINEIIEWHESEEELHWSMRDGCEKLSDDYNYHQRIGGYHFSSGNWLKRWRDKELKIGEAIGFG